MKEWSKPLIVILPLFLLAYSISYLISSLALFKLTPCINLPTPKLNRNFTIPIFTPLEKPGFFKSPKLSKNNPSKAQNTTKQTITFNLDNFILKGTIICSQCKHSIALLKNIKTGKTQPITIGQEIDGFKVEKIAPDFVILSKNGRKFQLKLFKNKKTQKTNSNRKGPIPLSSQYRQTYTVKRSEIINEISSGNFLKYINIVPINKPTAGLKVLYVNPRSFIYKLGIRPGDIITSINNIAIRTPEDSFSAFEQLKSSDSVTITVFRNRQKVTLHYELE